MLKRRDFIRSSAQAAVGASLFGATDAQAAPTPTNRVDEKIAVRSYRELGSTGLKISDISFGAGRLSSVALVARAVDMGINYFDTAPDYGASEDTIGEYLKKSPDNRSKIIIATKFCKGEPYPAHLEADAKEKDYIDSLEASLKRLKTDYADFVFVHAIGERPNSEMKRLLAEPMLSAVDKLKRAGKMKHLAVSSHGPHGMEKLLMAAVKSGHYDLIMPSFNFMRFEELPEVIKEASKRKLAVVAMKTLAGAKDMMVFGSKDLQKELTTGRFETAALKWVLSHKEIDGLVVTMKNYDDLNLYLSASGAPMTKGAMKILDEYKRLYANAYCRTGCGDCLSACPQGVDIASIMRYQMYYENYRQEKSAMASYARLKVKADVCSECLEAPCESACSHKLPVSTLLKRADSDLRLIA